MISFEIQKCLVWSCKNVIYKNGMIKFSKQLNILSEKIIILTNIDNSQHKNKLIIFETSIKLQANEEFFYWGFRGKYNWNYLNVMNAYWIFTGGTNYDLDD